MITSVLRDLDLNIMGNQAIGTILEREVLCEATCTAAGLAGLYIRHTGHLL